MNQRKVHALLLLLLVAGCGRARVVEKETRNGIDILIAEESLRITLPSGGSLTAEPIQVLNSDNAGYAAEVRFAVWYDNLFVLNSVFVHTPESSRKTDKVEDPDRIEWIRPPEYWHIMEALANNTDAVLSDEIHPLIYRYLKIGDRQYLNSCIYYEPSQDYSGIILTPYDEKLLGITYASTSACENVFLGLQKVLAGILVREL